MSSASSIERRCLDENHLGQSILEDLILATGYPDSNKALAGVIIRRKLWQIK
jgi:hypothetical protein